MKKILMLFALLTPLPAMATVDAKEACTKLMPKIERGYPLSNTSLIPKGYKVSGNEVNCMYSAAYQSDPALVDHKIAVTVFADIDMASNTFIVEVN